MKIILLILLVSTTLVKGFSQNCDVLQADIKGTYSGDCKSGKAHGNGKSTGDNIYEGEFKNGYADGKGKMIYKNGGWFEGNFKKGLMEGEGVLHLKTETNNDSVVTGFWKKGMYIGLYESPFKTVRKSYLIESAIIEELKSNSKPESIEIYITSVSGGAPSMYSGEIPKPILSDVVVSRGSFLTMNSNTSAQKSNFYYLINVTFPFHAILRIGQEEVVIELNKTANYKIKINKRD